MDTIAHINEKVLTSALLFEATGKSSAAIDSFSGWLLAALAASVAFLLGNIDKLSSHLSAGVLRSLLSIFLTVAVLGVLEKMLAVVLAGASAGAAVGRVMGGEVASRGIVLDVTVIFKEAEKAILPPARWVVRRSFGKAASGDIVAAARTMTRLAQIQGMVAMVQAVMVLRCVYLISKSVAF